MQVSLYSTPGWISGLAAAKHNPRTSGLPLVAIATVFLFRFYKRGNEILYPLALPGRPWALLYLAYGGRAERKPMLALALPRLLLLPLL